MTHPVLALGIGKVPMSDEGARVDAARRFDPLEDQDLELPDGGALGLSLLAEVESWGALIACDAASFGAEPGPARTFAGEEMGAQFPGKNKTAREFASFDFFATADLTGRKPEGRALIERTAS
jgi:hydrogenase maturation protease